jgi:zinc transport system substrate-binding protein
MSSSRTVPVLVVAALVLTGCAGAPAEAEGGRVSAVAGFYPYAFVTERVGGDDVDVTDLTSAGGEPHDLELTPRQVGTLGEADLVVYSAGFQPAVDEAVEQQAQDRALDVLSTVELRDGHGHGHDEEEGHGDEGHDDERHDDEGHEEEHASGDPHVWLDPVRLATIATAVAERLAEVDPDSAADYRARAGELEQELTALDAELRAGLSSCERSEIVTSHDAFGYLADAYGLEQVAVAGLSPEDEASPRRLAEVAAQAEAAGVTTVFFEESVSPAVAESLAREVGATATVLSPLELAPESGDYLSAMRDNLERLRTALGCS